MANSIIVKEPGSLQAFLFSAFPDVKRIKVKQWLKFGSVLVNGQKRTKHDFPVAPGDTVMIQTVAEARAASLLPKTIKLIHEDESLLVIGKPPGLLSIASVAEREKTAYAILTNYVRGGDPRSQARVWIVHRLDQETSGLMVFARTEAAKNHLQENWDAAEKRYLAVTEGHPRQESGTLVSFLDESNPHHVRSLPESEQTRRAETLYRVLKRTAELALVELTLVTGRRHQIRVQLQEIGCPIVGDKKYGARTDPAGRLGLHSSFLRVTHPTTGQSLEFQTDLPTSLAKLLRR